MQPAVAPQEIRSLNSRQLDRSVRMPAAYRQAEFELRGLVSKAVERGINPPPY